MLRTALIGRDRRDQDGTQWRSCSPPAGACLWVVTPSAGSIRWHRPRLCCRALVFAFPAHEGFGPLSS